jgi:hypothetical protein
MQHLDMEFMALLNIYCHATKICVKNSADMVTGLIPDLVIGFSNSPNPSSHTMALWSTQPLREINTQVLPGV